MRIFQRGINESLVIGRDVVVTVLEIQPTWVRLSIENPHALPSYREETLYLADDGDDDAETGIEAHEYAPVAAALGAR
jgi:carbon storage regulator CsrA